MMTYEQFKQHLTVFLWKQNDADLVSNLDALIRMGESELNRTLTIQRRNVTIPIAPTSQDYTLPGDFRHIVSLSDNRDLRRNPMMTQTTLQDIYAQRGSFGSGHVRPFFAINEGLVGLKQLLLVGPFSIQTPGDMTMVYRTNVPNFKVTGTSWLEADFLDLYTYTVLGHTAPFLREDERLQLWAALKQASLDSAIEEDRHSVQFGASPLQMRPSRRVP